VSFSPSAARALTAAPSTMACGEREKFLEGRKTAEAELAHLL
jgi:hypothetical protein